MNAVNDNTPLICRLEIARDAGRYRRRCRVERLIALAIAFGVPFAFLGLDLWWMA